jgi:soluble lytic murein transglycosylase
LIAAGPRFIIVGDMRSRWVMAAVVLAVVPAQARAAPSREPLRARFRQALALESAGRCRAAQPLFQRLWQDDPLLRPYYAQRAAACHLRAGEGERAASWAARVPEDAVPGAEAALVRLDVLAGQRRWPALLQESTQFQDRFGERPGADMRWPQARYQRALALEGLGRTAEAAAALREIWARAGSETWSARAEARLAALRPRLDADGRAAADRRAPDWVARGMVLFDRHDNQASEAAFTTALGAPGLTPALACLARYHQAQSVWKQRTRSRALPLFAEAVASCQAAGDADTGARAMYQRGRCLASTGDGAGARAQFAALEAAYPQHRLADDARLRAAQAAWEAGDDAAGDALASDVPRRYPAGDMLGEALWRLAYRSYRAGAFAEAARWLEENRRLVPRATVWDAEGRAEYWLGRLADKQGDVPGARAWYEQALRSYPLSVYALLAAHRLTDQAPAAAATLLRELRAGDGAAGTRSSRTAGARPADARGPAGLRRAFELAAVGLAREAQRELARLSDPDPETSDGGGDDADDDDEDDRDQVMAAAALLDEAELWNVSHALVAQRLAAFRRAYPVPGKTGPWTLAYPRAYRPLVEAASRANDVPPALQLALMREESAFDPRAVSTANCLGLTMLKPETARELIRRTPPVTREALLDPGTNIAGGSRHLAGLLRKFGAVVPAIAAYNAGEGAAARWLRERGQLPTDEFLEEIPYEETRRYTKRVLASYFVYAWLYAPRDPVPALTARP